MKKIILTLAIAAASLQLFAADPGKVSERIQNNFNKTFKNAQDVSWSSYTDYYEVKFKQNDIKVNIMYDLDGNVVRTLRYYYGDQLPVMVMAKVRSKYSQQKIYAVVEESSSEGTQYNITLEDGQHWYKVTANDLGEFSDARVFKKA